MEMFENPNVGDARSAICEVCGASVVESFGLIPHHSDSASRHAMCRYGWHVVDHELVDCVVRLKKAFDGEIESLRRKIRKLDAEV
jgi:hypothetical protein